MAISPPNLTSSSEMEDRPRPSKKLRFGEQGSTMYDKAGYRNVNDELDDEEAMALKLLQRG
jgi:hypothetical protein